MDGTPMKDHGDFRIQTPRNDDMKIVRESIQKAKINPTKPGHHWQRIVFKQDTAEGPIEIIKMYHVDRKRGVVEITETVNGVEEARRTMTVAEFG